MYSQPTELAFTRHRSGPATLVLSMNPISIIAVATLAVGSVVTLTLYLAWNRRTAFCNSFAAIIGAFVGGSIAFDYWFDATGPTSQVAYKAIGVWAGGCIGVAACTAVRFMLNPGEFAFAPKLCFVCYAGYFLRLWSGDREMSVADAMISFD